MIPCVRTCTCMHMFADRKKERRKEKIDYQLITSRLSLIGFILTGDKCFTLFAN